LPGVKPGGWGFATSPGAGKVSCLQKRAGWIYPTGCAAVKARYVTVYRNFANHELISLLCKLTLLVLYEFAVGVVFPVIDIYLLILELI
jgi:hypothetical protein